MLNNEKEEVQNGASSLGG